MKLVKDTDQLPKRKHEVSDEKAEEAIKTIIRWIGEDSEREGLLSTPKRVIKAFKEYFKGYTEDPSKFLSKTFTGRAIMAVSQDQIAVRLMAINPVRIKQIAFGLAIMTASLAGALLIVIGPVEPSMGRQYIGRVFAIAVLGGMGSVPGTLVAALILGIAESLTSTFYGPSWSPAVAFGLLLGALALRPQGLFGR